MSEKDQVVVEPDELRRARDIAFQYRLLISPNGEHGFLGNAIEMPRVIVEGRTIDACGRALQEALTGMVLMMVREGRTPPAPASLRRTEQVNVRLSTEERLALEDSARRGGYRGIAAYLRHLGLREIEKQAI